MEDYAISYNESIALISDFVLSLKGSLSSDSDYAFGSLGSFKLNEEGRFVFSPKEKFADISNYGFSSLNMDKIKRDPISKGIEQKGNYVRNIPWRYSIFRHAAAVAILVFALFMISHPLDKTNNIENYASFISTSLLKNPVIPVINEDILKDEDLSEFNLNEVINSNIDVEIPQSEIIEEVKTDIKSVREASSKPLAGRTYYIIIGSFPSEELAQRRISYFSRKGIENISIVQKDDKYRLYLSKFDDKSAANTYLDEIKQEQIFADAWLYSQKN